MREDDGQPIHVPADETSFTAVHHAVFNNGARSFSYFVRVENQIDANADLAMTMLLVVVFLYGRGEFRIFREFLRKQR